MQLSEHPEAALRSALTEELTPHSELDQADKSLIMQVVSQVIQLILQLFLRRV